jgi:hypothetical protein
MAVTAIVASSDWRKKHKKDAGVSAVQSIILALASLLLPSPEFSFIKKMLTLMVVLTNGL